MTRPLPLLGSREPWHGGPVAEGATCLLAPNPGPMTLDGTNTWILGGGPTGCVVIDPGPAHEEHLAAIGRVCERAEARIELIVLTHGHDDHSAGARTLARHTGAPVAALDPAHRYGSQGLGAGDVVALGDVELRVVPTPGHTWDSLSFYAPRWGALLTGDTVLGRGTTVVAHPDGRLDDYVASLRRLQILAEETAAGWVWPGHGPVLADPVRVVAEYLDHRQARLDQVRGALDAGAQSLWEVVEAVYSDVPRHLWPAAGLSVAAQLEYLGRADLIDLGD